MRGAKHGVMGLLVSVVVGTSGIILGQEPILTVTPPESAPILETEAAPVVTNHAPMVTNHAPVILHTNVAPVYSATNSAITHATNAVSVHPVTNAVVVHPATNEVPAPVPVAPPPAPMPTPSVVITAPSETVVIPEVVEASEAWASTSWQIGTRYTEIQMDQTKRGTPGNGSYFGSITTIAEEQDGAPNKVYLQVRVMKSPVWIGISYDHVRAETLDDITGDGIADPNTGDGSVDLQGVIPYVQAVWDNKTRFTPFVQLGYGFYEAQFEENEAWGSGGLRNVVLDGNVSGFELAGGLSIRIYKNVAADIFAKSMQIDDVTGEWYSAYGRFHGGSVVLPLSYVAYGAGVNCRF